MEPPTDQEQLDLNNLQAQYQPEPADRRAPQTQTQLQDEEEAPERRRVAFITAGTAGLGLACAVELARRGWSLFLHHAGGSAEDGLRAVRAAGEEGAQDVQVFTAPADLTDAAAREQLVERALESFARIDLLVNALPEADSPPADLLETRPEQFAAVLDRWLTATLFLTQLVAREMVRLVEAGQIENPKIVTLNSVHAYTSSLDRAPQCVAAAALAMVTRLLADRLGEHGIQVYEVRAGILATASTDPGRARYDALISEGLTPIRRWGRPGDVARAVAAVAEGLLSFSTGEVINVDGGFHLQRL